MISTFRLKREKICWALIEDCKYSNLKNDIYKLYSMFGTTYNCEAAFSSMKIILTKMRNKMNDQHLADLLRIKEYKEEVNLEQLLAFEEN